MPHKKGPPETLADKKTANKILDSVTWIGILILVLLAIFAFWKKSGSSVSEFFGEMGRSSSSASVPGKNTSVAATLPIAVQIQLSGADGCSKKEFDYAIVPPGACCYYEGPPGTRVRFSDGVEGPITAWYGVKGGRIRFFGAKDDVVTVRCEAPNTEGRCMAVPKARVIPESAPENPYKNGYPVQDPPSIEL